MEMELITRLRTRAFAYGKRIVLTDGTDQRVLVAAKHLVKNSAIRPILIGERSSILPQAVCLRIADDVEIYDPRRDPYQDNLTQMLGTILVNERRKDLPDRSTLRMMATDPTYCGALLIRAGLADGMVGGATVPTANVIRAGIQVVGLDPENPVVSGAFVMLLAEELPEGQDALVFGDAAVIPNPSAEQLASITINTARVTEAILGKEPLIALLSFSSYGSAEDSVVTKVRTALQLVRQRAPELCVDGELQVDAALNFEISQRKARGNLVQGRANVLIFPNLDASNIAYKLVQHVGKASALGVILSGLAQPINDLSRGCSSEDIVNMVAVTVLQAVQQGHINCQTILDQVVLQGDTCHA
jgi:phosphate acetyltransferase